MNDLSTGQELGLMCISTPEIAVYLQNIQHLLIVSKYLLTI